ncbi:uncharacterized protein LOC130891189 [Diorhabda carinulata]|uniref:uncharacterized protein LOC130891189 n=1 Tax=Diorhabda carinulata TaxID=1163345 RepID=UPI0025A2E351|nr:uncharacterized protein LOC130891189 [Diorhabda carinulata]
MKSLFRMVRDYVLSNIFMFMESDYEKLQALPYNIQNELLSKFMSSCHLWDISDYKLVLGLFANPHTFEINFTLTCVDDEMLSVIEKCKLLKKLHICDTRKNKFTSEALMNVLTGCSKLTTLIVRCSRAVTDEVVDHLVNNCPRLSKIDISGCKNVTPEGFAHLERLVGIQYLYLNTTSLNNDALTRIVFGPSGPHIIELFIDQTRVDVKGVRAVYQRCCSLHILIYYNPQGQDDLAYLMSCKELDLKNKLGKVTKVHTVGNSVL